MRGDKLVKKSSMNVHDSCGTSNKHNTLFDSEIFKGSSVMLVM